LRGCGDLFIWFGGPLHKRFQGPLVRCLLLPQTIGCYWLLQLSNPVSIGFHRDQTSFQSSALYLWALGKICFDKMSSSTLCCTVFLSNVFGHLPTRSWRTKQFINRSYGLYLFFINRSCGLYPFLRNRSYGLYIFLSEGVDLPTTVAA
jgi:hypothetical protein